MYIFLLVLQSLNQRPGQPMNMPGMQNKMAGMGMMPSQTGGPMNHMGQIQTMQNNPMLTQMNHTQMGQGNIPQMNQMVPGQMAQLSAGQMQQNMQVHPYINIIFRFIYSSKNYIFLSFYIYTYRKFRRNKYFIFLFLS